VRALHRSRWRGCSLRATTLSRSQARSAVSTWKRTSRRRNYRCQPQPLPDSALLRGGPASRSHHLTTRASRSRSPHSEVILRGRRTDSNPRPSGSKPGALPAMSDRGRRGASAERSELGSVSDIARAAVHRARKPLGERLRGVIQRPWSKMETGPRTGGRSQPWAHQRLPSDFGFCQPIRSS
jgi:hypothetical protein